MVAHMDTVHDIIDDFRVVAIDDRLTGFDALTMTQSGIGGDDKVGIYIALECLRTFDEIKIAFFRDEEVGCLGSYEADLTFFEDCRFVLQCDRRGNSDFVINASGVGLSSEAFQDDVLPIISGYGYSFAHGAMTDVMALKESKVKCSVANISCGYYNPHCPDEYVDVVDVENCLSMCKDIIEWCNGEYPHVNKEYAVPYTSYKYNYNRHQSWYAPTTTPSITAETYCKECWGAPAEKNGYCKMCNSWHESEVGDLF
jgi:hypothetical protein